MTREEKVDIMQEAILAEIDKLQKKMDGLHHGKVQNDNGSSVEEIEELRELIEKLGSVKIPVYKPEYSSVDDKLDKILILLKSRNNDPESQKVNHQNTGFLDSLKTSYILFNSGWLNGAFILLLLIPWSLIFLCFRTFHATGKII